ncbi:hypothetical protein LRS72_07930 [Limosilactobacillus fermentum]|nr:hypothetical protein [Limosilactobacillus fermentum]
MFMEFEYVLLDENGEPFFSTFNEEELKFAMQFANANAEVWYYRENSKKPYKKEKYAKEI